MDSNLKLQLEPQAAVTPSAAMTHESTQCTEVDQATTQELLTDALVQRFHCGAGLGPSAASCAAVELTRRAVKDFLHKLVAAMIAYMEHDCRLDLRLVDVTRACRYYGIHIYGYNDTIVLRDGSREHVLHVTELEEIRAAFDKPDRPQNEPDLEPGAHWAKLFLEQTQAVQVNDDEHDQDESDEWSWYDDSDVESSDDDDEFQISYQHKSFSACQRAFAIKPVTVLPSLHRVSTKLGTTLEPEQEDLKCDGSVHQEYRSGYGETRLRGRGIGSKKKQIEQSRIYQEDATNQLVADIENANLYVIPHQVFVELVRGLLERTIKISSVALNALHSTTERYLTRSLTNGVLRHQLQALIVEESAQELHDKLQLTFEMVKKNMARLVNLITRD